MHHCSAQKKNQNIPKQLISQTIPGTVSYSNDATACHQELRSFAATPMDGTSAKLEPPSQVGWKNKEAKIGNSKFHRNWVHQTNQTHSKSCRRKNDLVISVNWRVVSMNLKVEFVRVCAKHQFSSNFGICL